MPKYLAVVLSCAVLVLLFGAYLMAPSLVSYDMNKVKRAEAERIARLENGEPQPGFFSVMFGKVSDAFEPARNVYLGEYLPETPDGWKIAKTKHDELVDFTVDYKLDLTLNDKGSVRKMSGWGGTTFARSTDVKYVKDDLVIFVRLTHRQQTGDAPMKPGRSRLFYGVNGHEGDPIEIAGLTFEPIIYNDHDLINIIAPVGFDTSVGVFTNAPLADVEALLSGMDIAGFASLRGTGEGSPVLDTAPAGGDMIAGGATPDQGNMVAGLPEGEPETPMQADANGTAEAPKNLLSAFLGDESDKKKSGESGFKRVGSFASKCASGDGAKFCRPGE